MLTTIKSKRLKKGQKSYIRTVMRRFFIKYQSVIIYAISMAVVLLVLQALRYNFLLINDLYEFYILGIALIFTGLGIWIALKLMRPGIKEKTIIVEKPVFITSSALVEKQVNEEERKKLGISSREAEVLQLMAQGLSNQEIANKLFLSLATIKTHSSNLFEKLEVKRRTQAVDRARQLNLIA